MSLETLVGELNSPNQRIRIRAVYQLGILGDPSVIPALQRMSEIDAMPELRQAANAAIQHIQETHQMDPTQDAQTDLTWTKQFLQFMEQSPGFMAFDLLDLAEKVSQESAAILREKASETPSEKPPQQDIISVITDAMTPIAPPPPTAMPMPPQQDIISTITDSIKSALSPTTTTSQGGPRQESRVVGTYEMFWDCKYCGATKLLGVTHRHCPNCGAAQDPDARYHPPPSEEIALLDHVYVGADRMCPACDTPNSAAAGFCINCGGDLSSAAEVSQREDQHVGLGAGYHEDKRDVVKEQFKADIARAKAQRLEAERMASFFGRNRRKIRIGGGLGVIAVVIGSIFGFFFMRVSEEVTVVKHTWERTYEIQEYARVNETRDCPAPSDAYDVSRRTERRPREVPDGQDCREVCTERRVDPGDGSGQVVQDCNTVCETRYRTEYYNVEVCSYSINRWTDVDEEGDASWAIAGGAGINPQWPDVENRLPNCDIASEQVGQQCWENREEQYTLYFRRDNGKEVTCDFEDVDTWLAYEDGQQAKVKFTFFSRLRNKALCDEIEATN